MTGVQRLGHRWRHILEVYSFHSSRTPLSLKDKYRYTHWARLHVRIICIVYIHVHVEMYMTMLYILYTHIKITSCRYRTLAKDLHVHVIQMCSEATNIPRYMYIYVHV